MTDQHASHTVVCTLPSEDGAPPRGGGGADPGEHGPDPLELVRDGLGHGWFAALARRYQVPGAQVAIHHHGQTFTIETGHTRHGGTEPVGTDCAFPIGSITKVVTATAALALVADDEVELDAPLRTYLPELGELGDDTTLADLLSHTSGLACGPDSEDVTGLTARRYLAEHGTVGHRVLSPGTGFSYSNLGYVAVGRLIESITGMGWRDAVDSIVLSPLGIEATSIFDPPPARRRPMATGHSVNAALRRTVPVRQSLAPVEAPAGGLAASARDLVSLGQLHLAPGRPAILPPPVAARMRRPVAGAEPFGLADGWGLGLAVFAGPGDGWVGHDGNGDGTACYLRVDPAGGWVIGFTANANAGTAMWAELVDQLARAGVVGGLSVPCGWSAHRPLPTRAVGWPGCAGTYVNGGVEFVVLDRGGHLFLSVDDDPPAPVVCHADLTFSLRDPGSGQRVLGGRFVRDPGSGQVDGLMVGGRLARRRAPVVRAHSRIA